MPKCYFPRLIRNPNYAAFGGDEPPLMQVPCGKCYACLSARRRQWLFRLQQESLHSKLTFFLTLTYNEENKRVRLVKNDLHNFLRRIRDDFKSIKYYSIGEYGTRTKRPHYHALIFIKDVKCDKEFSIEKFKWLYFFRSKWPYGNIMVSEANIKRLNYICHYHTRPKQVKLPDGTIGETFCLLSKGLGLQFMTSEQVKRLATDPTKTVRDALGNKITVPRYYRKKFDIDAPEPFFDSKGFLQIAKERNVDPFDLLMDLRDNDTKKFTKYNFQEKF